MMPILSDYIRAAISEAQYKVMDDGKYFGEIPSLRGVWSHEGSFEQCRESLQEILEEWLLIKFRDGDFIPVIGGVDLNLKGLSDP